MSYQDTYSDPVGTPFFSVDESGRETYAEMNKGVTPIFFLEPVENPKATLEEGRPMFTPEERVRIVVAGDQYNQVVHPVDDAIRMRFADAYNRFKAKHADHHITGTPLRAWPLLKVEQVAEFEALNIFNVEGLANIAETNIARAPNLRMWRDKAATWLASAKDGAVAVQLAEKNAQLESDMATLKQQMAELSARLDKKKAA